MRIEESLAKKVVVKREPNAYKWAFGRVLLVGGQAPFGGAIIISALACVKSGAGLVSVATDRENLTALHTHLPEAMGFDMRDQDLLAREVDAATVILIGPGLAENRLSETIFNQVLERVRADQVLVMDASALNLLAKKERSILPHSSLVLTPHQKEWERLSGLSPDAQDDLTNFKALKDFPDQTILVHKRHQTRVYQGDKVGHITVGGPYQATGGMGDTLAGMIAGFLAQFNQDLWESVAAAVYLHSAIADHLSQDAYVVLPTQISQYLPKAMRRLLG